MSPEAQPLDNTISRAPLHAFEAMDVLRALTAMAVAVSHIRNIIVTDYAGQPRLAKPFYFITGYGHAGVVLFFVLSGFWISKTVVRRARDRHFWYEYIVDRLTRLWVVILPALAFGGVLDMVGTQFLHAPLYNGTSGAESLAGTINLSFTTLMANVFFFQNLFAPVYGSNGPLWSLAFEFWYYLWFPAIWLAVRYNRKSLALLTLPLGVMFPSLAIGFLSWLCGAAVFATLQRFCGVVERRAIAIPLVLAGSALFGIALLIIRLYPFPWIDPLLAIAFSAFLVTICATNLRWRGTGALARFGGRASFSLYATHYPIAALAAAIIAPGARLPFSIGTTCCVVVVLLISIGVAILFSMLTEAHTGRLRQMLRVRRHLLP